MLSESLSLHKNKSTSGEMTVAAIYSNGSQECERAASLMSAAHLDEVVVYHRDRHFTEEQFREEFGEEVEYPMISIGMFRGTLKETMNYMNDNGMFL